MASATRPFLVGVTGWDGFAPTDRKIALQSLAAPTTSGRFHDCRKASTCCPVALRVTVSRLASTCGRLRKGGGMTNEEKWYALAERLVTLAEKVVDQRAKDSEAHRQFQKASIEQIAAVVANVYPQGPYVPPS